MAHSTESFWIRCDGVRQHISKKRERCAVRSGRVGRYVNGGNDHSALVVTACSHDDVLAVSTGSQQALEESAILHVSVADTRNVLRTHRVCVENGCCNSSITLEALEGSRGHVVHDWVEWISDIEACVENLGLWCVSALDIHTKRQTSIQSNVKAVDLASLRTKVRLYGAASGHERLERLSVRSRSKLLVVTTTTAFNVLCSDVFLPWQENLVVVRHPSRVKIGRPIVNAKLCVRHTQELEILLDG